MSEKTSASVLMILWLMAMKVSLKKKNRSQRYDTNWPRSRYRNVEMYPSIMVICIKQHLRNNWSSIHEKVNMPSRAGGPDRVSALPQSLLTMCSFFFFEEPLHVPFFENI